MVIHVCFLYGAYHFHLFMLQQDMMGGEVEIIFSGAAPLSGDVMTFLRCAFGCHVSSLCIMFVLLLKEGMVWLVCADGYDKDHLWQCLQARLWRL